MYAASSAAAAPVQFSCILYVAGHLYLSRLRLRDVSLYMWGPAPPPARTLDPIRCTLCVKPGGSRVLTSGQNQLFPSRGYIAKTYAKVMGSSSPSQPRIKLKCTLFVC